MTIKEIAKESGYAIGTVSRVLNNSPDVSEKARTKVMEVVEKYHFRLNNNAKHLKQQTNSGIAIIVKGNRNMLFANMVEYLQRNVKSKGYTCMLYFIGEDDHEVEQALQVCKERLPSGILFLGSNLENFKERFAEVEVPCVLVTNPAASLGFDNLSSVSVDDKAAAVTMIEHLISLGHKKIGVLGGEINHSNPARSRFEGCLKAFKENNIEFDVEQQFESSYFTIEGGYYAMEKLLERVPGMTAVFAMSDVTALGAIRAAKDKGLRVPEDLTVVGFDGIEVGQYFVPKLTTIMQPSEEVAARCVEILAECITGKASGVYEKVPFCFIQGESSAPLQECE